MYMRLDAIHRAERLYIKRNGLNYLRMRSEYIVILVSLTGNCELGTLSRGGCVDMWRNIL